MGRPVSVIDVFDDETKYLAIINPQAIFRVSRFFIDYWLPLLGPRYAWLVVAIRQAARGEEEEEEDGRMSLTRLGELSGTLTETEVNLALGNQIEQFFLDHFIQSKMVYVESKGQRRNVIERQVVLSDPLPPHYILALKVWLSRLKNKTQYPSNEILADLIDIPKDQVVETLNSYFKPLTEEHKKSLAEVPPTTFEEIVYEVLGNTETALIKKLESKLLAPRNVLYGNQYFRRKWVPEIGAFWGWFIMLARDERYRDENGNYLFTKKQVGEMMGIQEVGESVFRNYQVTDPFHIEPCVVSHRRITGRITTKEEEPFHPSDLNSGEWHHILLNTDLNSDQDLS